MRDDEDRAALHQLIHAALDDGLGAGVDGGGGLVQDHDRGIGDRGARDSEQLPLALREVGAVVRELGLVALGQTGNEIIRTGQARGFDALLVACVQPPVANVLHDGAGEEVGLLQHDAERAAQILLLDLVDVDRVVADLAVGDVVEAVDEVCDGGLARAGRADEGHLLAGLGIDGDVVQHVLALFVGEVHVQQTYVAAQRGIGQRAVAVRMAPGPLAGAFLGLGEAAVGVFHHVDQRHVALVGLGRLVHEGEDTARAGGGHDDLVDLLGQGVDVAGELLGHAQEGHQHADGEGLAGQREVRHAAQQEDAARQGQRHIEDVADVVHDRAEQTRVGVGLAAVLAQLVVARVEGADGLLLVVEDLDDLLAVHELLNDALGLGQALLLLDEVACGAAAHDLGDEEHRGHADQQHQRHPEAEVEHDEEHHQHHRAGLDEGGQGLGDQHAQCVDIVGVVAHDVAVLMGIKKADGQILHLVEGLLPQLVQKALGHDGHELGVGGRGDQRQHIQDREDRHKVQHLRSGGSPVAGLVPALDDGDDVLREQRGDGRDDGGKQNAAHRQRSHAGVVGEELLDGAAECGEVRVRLLSACADGGGAAASAAHGSGFRHSPHLRSSAGSRSHGRSDCGRAARRACRGRRCGRCP